MPDTNEPARATPQLRQWLHGRRTYRVGELLTLRSGAQWRVRNVYPHDDGNPGVGLVNPSNPNHGTAFYADVLDTLVVAEPARPTYPESGDYPVGNYEVSARRDDNDVPEVMVSGVRFNTTLFVVSPAEARALATALRVAADQADADAGTDVTADDTPDWPRALDVGAVPQRLVFTPETAPAGLQVLADSIHATQQRIAALYANTPIDRANRETVGAEETEECEYLAAGGPCNHVISCDGPQSIGPVTDAAHDMAHDVPRYAGDGYPNEY